MNRGGILRSALRAGRERLATRRPVCLSSRVPSGGPIERRLTGVSLESCHGHRVAPAELLQPFARKSGYSSGARAGGAMDTGKRIEAPARKCERCSAQMEFIVTLPRESGAPSLNVFRCLSCGNAATESIADTR
jgi:hypothetical protein